MFDAISRLVGKRRYRAYGALRDRRSQNCERDSSPSDHAFVRPARPLRSVNRSRAAGELPLNFGIGRLKTR